MGQQSVHSTDVDGQVPTPKHINPNSLPDGEVSRAKLAYRPLNHDKGEFRLLKILPPTASVRSSDGLEFSPDTVHCILEYESMNYIEEINRDGVPGKSDIGTRSDVSSSNTSTSEATRSSHSRVDVKENFLEGPEKQHPAENRAFEMPAWRQQMLRARFSSFIERQDLLPPADFQIHTPALKWDSWIDTWIWSSLDGNERHPQRHSAAYLALSYVWSDARSLADADEDVVDNFLMQLAGGASYEQAIEHTGMEIPTQLEASSERTRIVVDGVLVEVGSNLEKALRSLREIPEVQRGQRVWVDSLCIDQSNIAEKNREVRRMGEIYGNAQRVVSWIGCEEDCSDQALEFMNIIGQSVVRQEEISKISQWFLRNIRSEISLRVTQLLSRPYWKRIWVTQEVVLGDDKAITICGPRRFPTWVLLKFAIRMTMLGDDESTTLSFNSNFDLAEGHSGCKKPVSAGAWADGLRRLSNLLQLQVNLGILTSGEVDNTPFWFRIASSNLATDPRDKLYGMLNILPKSLVSSLTIDYSETHSYRDVMIDFAVAHFTMSQSLISLLHRPWVTFPGWRQWPSWVPNLGLRFSIADYNWAMGLDCNGESDGLRFKVLSGGASSHDIPMLALDGLLVDTIGETTLSERAERRVQYEQLVSDPDLAARFAQNLGLPFEVFGNAYERSSRYDLPEPPPLHDLKLPQPAYHRYVDLHGLKNALAQCLERMTFKMRKNSESIFDIPLTFLEHEVPYIDSAAATTLPTFETPALHHLKSILHTFDSLDLWGVRFRDLFAGGLKCGGSDGSSPTMAVPQIMANNSTPLLARLFKTSSGYVGAALCPLRAGDRIYIIPGCPMPVALRPSDRVQRTDAFELVGGLFVPGIMDGEAWAAIPKDERDSKMENIVLV